MLDTTNITVESLRYSLRKLDLLKIDYEHIPLYKSYVPAIETAMVVMVDLLFRVEESYYDVQRLPS